MSTRRPVRRRHDDGPRLRRGGGGRAWTALLWRVVLVLGLIGIALAGHWLERDGLRDNIDGHISFVDVIYFTMITITTVGYGDIVPVTDGARLFDTFVVTPVRLFVWLIFLGSAYQFLLRGVWERWRMRVIQHNLSGHTVIAGYGTSGEEAVRELVRRGADPRSIVVVEPRAEAAAAAEAAGVTVLEDDATRNATLVAAQAARARGILVSAGRDDTSILIVLTARLVAPHVPISVVVRSDDNEVLARQAGATTVINPASFAGLLLAGSCHGPHIADYLADLANADGRVSLTERAVAAEEVGHPLGAIATGVGLRVYRGETAYGFWEPEARTLRAGDVIVEVQPSAAS